MNWSLASEWFTVWGDAYRNADRALLLSHLKCIRDDNNNAYCKRTYREDIPSCTKDFEELSDNIKEFLSKVPNLYVEDAAIASGRLLETRIRSVTNDPATALVMKNLLVLYLLYYLFIALYASSSSSNSSSIRFNSCSWNERIFYFNWYGSSFTCINCSYCRRCLNSSYYYSISYSHIS